MLPFGQVQNGVEPMHARLTSLSFSKDFGPSAVHKEWDKQPCRNLLIMCSTFQRADNLMLIRQSLPHISSLCDCTKGCRYISVYG